MLAEQHLHDANPAEALTELQAQIRKEPAKAGHRIFLFQLLAVLGQWDRALNQLKVLADLDAETLPMVQSYREAIRCEMLRAAVFSGQKSPVVFGKPEPWLALLIEALRGSAGGETPQSGDLRRQALELAPATGGTIDERPFEWIADADSRIGPVLEAVVNGRYYWIPFHRIREIEIEKPADLRDFVWTPAQFTFANGGQSVGLIPTRYAGSEADADPLIQLARKTDWTQRAEDVFTGLGQRTLTTDLDDFPLLDIRKITLESEDEPAEDGDDGAPHLDADVSLRHG